MSKSLEQIFKETKYIPEDSLSDAVWQNIIKKQQKFNTIRVVTYSFAGVVSLFGLIFVIKDIVTQFSQSGFYEYISLVSSDIAVVTTYWKEFALSLTESLPIISITISLFLLFILSISIRKVLYQYKYQLLTE